MPHACCTEEDRSFWLTYDKKPSGSRVAQSIGVGLGKATVMAVPEGIRRLCDAIPVIWGALTRYRMHSSSLFSCKIVDLIGNLFLCDGWCMQQCD